MSEWDKWFNGTTIKERANGMEKKKLLGLNENMEKYWKMASKLESDRNKLRANLIPNNRKELQKLKDERDAKLQVKTEEARQIKEDRKRIHTEFYFKTKHIRESRMKQLKSDPELFKNQIDKNKAWETMQKYSREFHDYYGKLNKKYSKVRNMKAKRTETKK